jgi:hypothetical protein
MGVYTGCIISETYPYACRLQAHLLDHPTLDTVYSAAVYRAEKKTTAIAKKIVLEGMNKWRCLINRLERYNRHVCCFGDFRRPVQITRALTGAGKVAFSSVQPQGTISSLVSPPTTRSICYRMQEHFSQILNTCSTVILIS